MKMKHYYIKLNLLLGGYEKDGAHLVTAPNEEDAIQLAFEMEAHDPDEEQDHPQSFSDVEGEFVYELYSIKEVSEEDLAVLKKYI